MTHNIQLTNQQKQALKARADKHIHSLHERIDIETFRLDAKVREQLKIVPEMQGMNIELVSPDSEVRDLAIAKARFYLGRKNELETIRSSPYFIKLSLQWTATGENSTIYISKHQLQEENIYSWVSPISTLRFSDIGSSEYQKPDGTYRKADISTKDNFIITGGEIVFMTHQDTQAPRQVVYQKHMDERKEFLLPEIVAELDKLQDQIIRSDPSGSFLISGPAGSGKTTLALHRVAYLVLTPEFKEFFDPKRIIVFVADSGAITYFGKLLPELGINGVRITTFSEWSLMIANSRFRASRIESRFKLLNHQAALEHISEHNPIPDLHPRLVLEEYRKLKQQLISPLDIRESGDKHVYTKLHGFYLLGTEGIDEKILQGFTRYLTFQKQHKYLDEIDLIILLESLENPITPFAHVVVDEVQNWLPEQLRLVKTIAERTYRSITYIGDIRQKTKPFTIDSWDEIDEKFDSENESQVELLKVYRNTRPILNFLAVEGYDVQSGGNNKEGEPVEILELTPDRVREKLLETIATNPEKQIGILSKYQSDLEGLEYLGYENENIHVLTIEEAQGLEFHTVVLLNSTQLKTVSEDYPSQIGLVSAQEYSNQDRHLFYVAATRAQKKLVLIN